MLYVSYPFPARRAVLFFPIRALGVCCGNIRWSKISHLTPMQMIRRLRKTRGCRWLTFCFWGLSIFLIHCTALSDCTALTKCTAADGKADNDIHTTGVPPHLILFISDVPAELGVNGEAGNFGDTPKSITAAGMRFTRMVASAVEPPAGRQVLETGKVFAVDDSTRTLADHLKLKGYRLMVLGDEMSKANQEGEFRFDVISDSLERFRLRESSVEFQRFLELEISRDHRPLCLIIREHNANRKDVSANVGNSPLEHSFKAVRDALPVENTIFVYTTICGEPERQTSVACDQCRLDIPLTVVWDGHIPAGRTSDALVSSVDILPTLVELAGATPPSEIDGRSFAGVLRGESHEHRDVAFSIIDSGKPSERYCVHDSRFIYISGQASSTHAVALYDLFNDPQTHSNLKEDPGHRQRVVEMREQLDLWLQRHGRSSLTSNVSD